MNQLKEAEKSASLLVSEARKARVERMKEAKTEAEAAIAAYRAEMEAEYQKNVSKLSNSSDTSGGELDSTTIADIATVTDQFNSNKAVVTKMLCDHVCSVNTTAPKARDQ